MTAAPVWMHRKERGSMFWLSVIRWISLRLGRAPARLIVYGIALYFLLTSPAARQASRIFLGRALGRPANCMDLYRHILTFASTIHDRIFLLNERDDLFDIQAPNVESVHEMHHKRGGLLLFGAHMGSFEVLRCLARSTPWLKLSMAMYEDNARRINTMLEAINPQAMQDIIRLGQLDSMLTVHHRLEEGIMVGILADRAAGKDSYQTVSFLGVPAHFPTGPFRMAAMLRQPVFFMAGLYQGGNHYALHFEQIADFSTLGAGERSAAIETAVQRYAAVLEQHCRTSPYNWFNFFDFWESARADKV